jgi:hypothetical protein
MRLIPENKEHAFVRADCGPRAVWQFLVQRFVANDDVTEVNLLLLAEHIKEPSGAIDGPLSQFSSQHVGDPSEMPTFHVHEHGGTPMTGDWREAQNLSNRTNC